MSDKRKEVNTPDQPDQGDDETQVCGIIMPISATASHSEQHWNDVQKLLHRAIVQAGFRPLNVWSDELTDRVSERIIGNIFTHALMIADITDLNPNVMLELGLRLSSRKPTLVIAAKGSAIPFDIRDFHVLGYPPDLHMLGMEEFMKVLVETLKIHDGAAKNNTYTPFLGKFVVDVLEPETRTRPFEDIILSRLDDIAARVVRIEQPSTSSRARSRSAPASGRSVGVVSLLLDVETEAFERVESAIDNVSNLISFAMPKIGSYRQLRIDTYGDPTLAEVEASVRNILSEERIGFDKFRFVYPSS